MCGELQQMPVNTHERNLLAISIKHTEHRWQFGKPCVLWGMTRTQDEERRCFGGYTIYPSDAELYSLDDWAQSGYAACEWMKIDAPVKLSVDLCKKYREYDTVLVMAEDYIKYCEAASLPLEGAKGGGNG